jgi:hypothetical protein
MVNAATVPVAYLLAQRLTGRAWAGVLGALVTGLVSLIPAYYVNWGRYSQLAGQVILPVLMILTMETVEKRPVASFPSPVPGSEGELDSAGWTWDNGRRILVTAVVGTICDTHDHE